jgi:hypothetical protein
MKFEHKLLNKDGKVVKDIAKAMWLLVGTNLKAKPRIIGDKNKRISDVALRAFMDTVVYERYQHALTTPDRHIYSWVDGDAENAGAEEVDELKDGKPTGFKTYLQVSIDAGTKSLSKFQSDRDFPAGPSLRIKKHARIKIILQDLQQEGGFCHKIYIAHKRDYIEKGLFIGQMLLAEKGEVDAAREIRDDKIAISTGNRKAAYEIKEAKGNGNWEDVEKQLAELEGVEPVEVPEGEDPPEGDNNGDNRTLFMPDYNGGAAVDMFTLDEGRYGMRRNTTPGFWYWNPNNEGAIKDWLIMQGAGYKVDLKLTQ